MVSPRRSVGVTFLESLKLCLLCHVIDIYMYTFSLRSGSLNRYALKNKVKSLFFKKYNFVIIKTSRILFLDNKFYAKTLSNAYKYLPS